MGHWYTRDGEPMHWVPNQSRPGEDRNTTVADAKKLALLPSVSTILRIIHKEDLQRWHDSELLEAAWDLAPYALGDQMTGNKWKAMVRRAGRQQSAKSMDLGTLYHEAVVYIVQFMESKGEYPRHFEDKLCPDILGGFVYWYGEHRCLSHFVEKTFAETHLGYGGCSDWGGEVDGVKTICDWKFSRTKPGEPVKFYMDYGTQLAAYQRGLKMPDYRIMSVVVSTSEPGRIETKIWDNENELFDLFRSAFIIWKSAYGANFNPLDYREPIK